MQGVKLTAQEGFVLSRIVGPTSLGELVGISGLEEEQVIAIVRRLAAEGTVDVEPPLPSLLPPPPHPSLPPLPLAPPPLPKFVACGLTDVGIARSNNEDAFRIVDMGPRGMLLVVCDGMGGESAGEIASALAVEVICSHMLDGAGDAEPAVALRGAVDHANELVTAAADDPGRHGMGTTAIAALLRGTDAFTAEVGDSRAYVLRGGALTQITKDQTYVQVLLDQGLLAPDSVKTSVAKNVVLQAVGKAPELVVAQRRLALRNGDLLLLCSDGLSSYVSDEEIRDVLMSSVAPDAACTELVALANARGGHDNITVIVAQVADGMPPPTPSESIADTLTTLRAYTLGL
ncbi:MAG: family protein phosphatase [Myxococcales bacterium]|nr:family protein phosphatase [Myxococcales bacterium]